MVELVQEPTETSRHILNQHPHGIVVRLQLCMKHRAPMEQVSHARAVENYGLEGDRHAMPESSRQVLLFAQETCVEYDFPIGALRENITTRGIDLMSLPKGTVLETGDVRLEITKECEPCGFVDDVREGLREELKHKRGVLARVVRGGVIRVGQEIRAIAPSAQP